MATLGLVSVVKDGKVVFKCVAGMDGMAARKVAAKIRKLPFDHLTVKLLYQLCIDMRFGHKETLVVQSENENYCDESIACDPRPEDDLYENKDKFKDPKFNPRWECGLSDHVSIVKF